MEVTMHYICNPLNINYRYQFNADPRKRGLLQICREAADPSMIQFGGRYYIFASMTLGVLVSDDLAHWEYYSLPKGLPLYDYAPDVRVMGDYVYFCASNREKNCDRWRTKNILEGPYEKLEGSFPFWDPNLFVDEDGRVYFYWGCSNITPIYGVELDPKTMLPMGEKVALIEGHPETIGYERVGENNSRLPASEEEIERRYQAFIANGRVCEDRIPEGVKPLIRGMLSDKPYIEGAWMDRYQDRYYLQYAAPGTQYNTYSDGVYVADHPLGPFRLAENNPYSYRPGGFMPGAGHGSTMRDKKGAYWHTATMRISANHDFERRIGIWPAGFDANGQLFSNQRYGDWPMSLEAVAEDPWRDPDWMLLSVGKRARASSSTEGHGAELACEENARSWWQAKSADRSEWLQVDLGSIYQVYAIQINFADDKINIPCPGQIHPGSQARYIDEAEHVTQWKLEGSLDGENWFVIEDKSRAKTDLPHDLLIREEGLQLRYVRVSQIQVPFDQAPCISGLRIFGRGEGAIPAEPDFTAHRDSDIDMTVAVKEQEDALGYNILFGNSEDKLYHSLLCFEAGTHRVGALIQGREYFVRVDAFNENGIRRGECRKL